jgi:membrane-bound lytic murein transglycosylase D
MRLWWRYHKLQPGETLASVSRTYRTTSASIADINHLDGAELEANARLLIPIAPGKHPLSDTVAYSKHMTRYKVRRGDTVESVAETFGVPAQMVRRWNGLRGSGLKGRRVLAIRQPITPSAHDAEATTARQSRKSSATAARKTGTSATATQPDSGQAGVVHHKVKSGESLHSIAIAYNTTVAALKRDNHNIATLRPGMILIVQPSR